MATKKRSTDKKKDAPLQNAQTSEETKTSDKSQTPKVNLPLGVGLDMGTVNVIMAYNDAENKEVIKTNRNAFLTVRDDDTTKNLITKLGMVPENVDNKFCLCGNQAAELADYFDRTIQRPMSNGILNPLERSGIPMLNNVVQKIIREPVKQGEICCFSIPSDPIDLPLDILYHRSVLETMLSVKGYKPIPLMEGFAIVLSELKEQGYTGIGVSCGGGMVNVSIAYKSVPLHSFSIVRGGDWIDLSTSQVLGISTNKVINIKEGGMDIRSPKNREEEAIAIYYKQFIHYIMEEIAKFFSKEGNGYQFDEPVDMAFGGGTSLIKGFSDVVKRELRNLPFENQIRNILQAKDIYSVARGCLHNAKIAGQK